MQTSCGSLQVWAGGFRVCKNKQTYVTLSHNLVSNHAPKKNVIYDQYIYIYIYEDLRVRVTHTSILSTEPSP